MAPGKISLAALTLAFSAVVSHATPWGPPEHHHSDHSDHPHHWRPTASSSSEATPTSTSHVEPTSSMDACYGAMDGELPSPTPPGFKSSGNVRRYYIAAEEVEWDYAPTGWDNWLGVPINSSFRANAVDYSKFGTKWLKPLYRGYTDSSFTEYSEQPAWQGIQGPTIRSEVGDLIEIMFMNKLSKNYATMHSMGLQYTKVSEGSAYPNNTMPGAEVVLPEGDAVPPVENGVGPGSCVVYKWIVDESSGPNGDEPAKTHSYHSYVDMRHDTTSGLIGPQITYGRGKMASTMANNREFTLLYSIYHESLSLLSAQNAKALGGMLKTPDDPIDTMNLSPGNHSVWHPQAVNFASAGQFPDAPDYHTLNGYVFANNPVFESCLGDKVIWYVNGYGSESHVFHMHGNNFRMEGNDEYAVSLNDGVGRTLYMDAVGSGKWQVVCHVADHLAHGMVADYQVHAEGMCKLPALGSS